MDGMKKLLYVAFGLFLASIVVAALIVVFVPRSNGDKMEEYQQINSGNTTVVVAPEYKVGDEFRKESISDF